MEQAVVFDRYNYRYRFYLANYYRDNNKFDLALKNYRFILETRPYDYYVLTNYGVTLFVAGQIDNAKSVFEKILRLYSGHQYAQKNLMAIEKWEGKNK